MFGKDIFDLAGRVVRLCNDKGILLTTAESCTGGLVSAALTEIPGASGCLAVSFVTYSDYMKTRLLGVDSDVLKDKGAVSEGVAREMAAGALKAASADVSVAITGIAGPEGGSPEKPVGTVHFATALRVKGAIQTHHERHYIKKPGRSEIRLEATRIALSMLLQAAQASQEN